MMEASTSGGGAGGSVPADDSTAHIIQVKVQGQDGQEVFFKMRKGTPMRKLIDAYCNRTSQSPDYVAFLFDGRKISPEQTPRDLQLEDGDEIDAMLHQTGGEIRGL